MNAGCHAVKICVAYRWKIVTLCSEAKVVYLNDTKRSYKRICRTFCCAYWLMAQRREHSRVHKPRCAVSSLEVFSIVWALSRDVIRSDRAHSTHSHCNTVVDVTSHREKVTILYFCTVIAGWARPTLSFSECVFAFVCLFLLFCPLSSHLSSRLCLSIVWLLFSGPFIAPSNED